MKFLHIIFLAAATLAYPLAMARGDVYHDDFTRFLHITGKAASGSITCSDNPVDLHFTAGRTFSGTPEPDKSDPEYAPFAKENVPATSIYFVSYSQGPLENLTFIIEAKNAQLHVDSPSRIRFTFLDDPRVFHLELVDVRMTPIRSGKLPKNSRYTRTKNEYDDGYTVTAPAAVYFWLNDEVDQKKLCDIDASVG
ncbi:MAG: hypothetical protein LBP58_02715 [Azoarcus sp.]|jgi:hypothetical protein|nr:hypothetical protein [Azoarcus sp.]